MTKRQQIYYTTLVSVLAFLMLLSASVIWLELQSRENDKDEFENLQNRIETMAPVKQEAETEQELLKTETTVEISKEEMISETEALHIRNLTPLFEENSDCVGWINIPDTTVDYPVMHTPEEPEKYLRLNFYKEFSYSGVPFIDARCRLDSDNVFIYGHNMKNGTMFSDITNYTIYEYCLDNPVIVLETADGYREYTVCAVLYTDTTDSWFSFIDAENEDDFNNRIAFMKKESLHDLGVTPEYGQSLITLSTCDNTDDSMRLLVIAADIN